MACIWVLSSMTFESSLVDSFPLRDKGVHLVEYAILGVLVVHAAMRTWPAHSRWRTALVGLTIGISWGLIDEFHQAFVPGRDASALDLIWDAIGVVVGTGLRLGLHAIRVQLQEEKP